MSDAPDFSFDLDAFTGTARLFPLPNLVLFPHVLQPLHIFEPRYRELMDEALAGDRSIALAVLRPGWELEYEGRPALHSIACLGRVATHQRLEDGRYNLLLLGLRRIEIRRELEPRKLFREAEVAVLEDHYPVKTESERPALQRQLLGVLKQTISKLSAGQQQTEQLLSGNMSLGMLTDILAYTLDVPLKLKVKLLEELNVDRRARLLVEHWQDSRESSKDASSTFPPDFSVN